MNLYFSLDTFDHDMKLALALSAQEAMKSKELDIGGSSRWFHNLDTCNTGTEDVISEPWRRYCISAVWAHWEFTVLSLITCLFCQLCMHEELSLWVCVIFMELCVSVIFIIMDGVLGGSREHMYMVLGLGVTAQMLNLSSWWRYSDTMFMVIWVITGWKNYKPFLKFDLCIKLVFKTWFFFPFSHFAEMEEALKRSLQEFW